MKHFNSIKKYADFQKVYRTGKSYANRLLIMYVMKTEEGPIQGLAFPSAKKWGTAWYAITLQDF